MIRLALPCTDGQVCMHFGHASGFMFFDIDPETKTIHAESCLDAPEHRPGLLPQWLAEQGTNVILAGGMGMRAQELLAEKDIRLVMGVHGADPQQIVRAYMEGTLSPGANPCDH